ncbi:DNA polymerase III subunit epsilon, partial [Bacillus tequilensis]|nr:DNA polymerase III subunit epsilon [Bacillus tequilensis]
AFIDGAELVIHNAAFDVGFLDNELRLAGAHYGCLADRCRIEDSLALARERYPGQRNSLDALCRRLGVDNTHRQLHGALLDAQLLAEVYIGLTSGQEEIGFGSGEDAGSAVLVRYDSSLPRPRVAVQAAERAAHEARLQVLRARAGQALWDRFTEAPADAAEALPA